MTRFCKINSSRFNLRQYVIALSVNNHEKGIRIVRSFSYELNARSGVLWCNCLMRFVGICLCEQNNSHCDYLKDKSKKAIDKQYSWNQNSLSLHKIWKQLF